jgi:hypothetical protein
LWDRLLSPAQVYTRVGFDLNADGLQAQILTGALANLPPINLPDSLPLFALLAVYTVLIGPGLALFLRRMDRQALGWFVLPAVALGVTAIATGLAMASRADQRIVSQATLVQQVNGDTALARSAIGVLTPRDEAFVVTASALAVVRPLVAGSATFGPISGASGDLGQDGAPIRLELSRWELQGAQAEALVPLPALVAELRVGADGIVAVVRNSTGQRLRDVTLFFAGIALPMGDLAPDAEASAPWPIGPRLGDPRPEAALPLSVLVLGDELVAGRAPGSALERSVLVREALLNAAAAPGQRGVAGPLALAWLDESPLGLTLDAPDAAMGRTTLLAAPAQIAGSGSLVTPAGWMQLESTAGQQRCAGEPGFGLLTTQNPLTMTLALPADLATIRAETFTLDLQSEREWPNAGVTTELYDWERGAWVNTSFDGPGTLAVQNAAPYVQGGRALVRLSGQIEGAGCVYANAIVRGTLP